MSDIGKNCYELRINEEDKTWRIIYGTDQDAIIILDVFAKKTEQTPKKVIEECKKRLKKYKNIIGK